MTAREIGSAASQRAGPPVRAAWHARALASYEAAIYAALLLVCAGVSLIAPRFLQPDNLFEVARNFSFIAAVGVGEAIVILTGGGGIDLSVGSLMGLGGVVRTKLVGLGVGVPCAIGGGGAGGWGGGGSDGVAGPQAGLAAVLPMPGLAA